MGFSWIAILIAAAAFISAFFISRDARKRGRNGLFWFIFTIFLFGICAIPVYFHVIRREKKGRAEALPEGRI